MKKNTHFVLFWVFYLCTTVLFAQNNRPVTNNVQDMEIFYHTVDSGQTVYSIAKMYDVMVIDIYRLNPSSEKSIKAGERLKIPQRRFEEKSILNVQRTNNVNNVAQTSNNDGYIIHTILKDETLYGLTKKYGVSEEQIYKANPGLTSTNFTYGKNLRIPIPGQQKPIANLQQKPIAEVVVRNGVKEVYYTIPEGETKYNICRRFKTTEEELLNLNPELSGGLRIGMTIRFPLRISENELPKGFTRIIVQRETPVEPVVKLKNAAKVALLLPIDTDNPILTTTKRRFIEYYEGFLLAADSLKNQGREIELFVREIGEGNLSKTRKLLQNEGSELQNVHLIIGGHSDDQISSDQIKLIAEFAKQNSIKYVIPFSRNEVITDNPFVFQVNTPPSYLIEKAANAGANLFAKYNIIFLDTKEIENQTDFIIAYQKELKSRNISWKETTYDVATFEETLLSLLSTSKPNMIIPLSQSLTALHKIKTILKMIADSKPEYNLTLFGYPIWQTYIINPDCSDCLDIFHALNTYIFSYFYADNIHSSVKSFNDTYKSWYNKSPMIPSSKSPTTNFALLGFDTGMFFLSAIQKYGVAFEELLSEHVYKSLQTGFDFERLFEGSGFINTNIFIVHYHKDYSITRSEYK